MKPPRAIQLVCLAFLLAIPISWAQMQPPQKGQQQMPPWGRMMPPPKPQSREKDSYYKEEYRFSIVPPKGLAALSDEEVERMVSEGRKSYNIPDAAEGEKPPITHTFFKAPGFDPAARLVKIVAEYPLWQTMEEFERNITPDTGDFVVHSRETINLKRNRCFVLDREYDAQGTRFRQYACYVQDYIPMVKKGFLLIFSSVSVEFDLYEKAFMDSLKTFTVYPPEMPEELKQDRYSVKKRQGGESWRSLPVIGSLVFVAVFAIWFLVKRLSAGAEEEEAEDEDPQSPNEEGVQEPDP